MLPRIAKNSSAVSGNREILLQISAFALSGFFRNLQKSQIKPGNFSRCSFCETRQLCPLGPDLSFSLARNRLFVLGIARVALAFTKLEPFINSRRSLVNASFCEASFEIPEAAKEVASSFLNFLPLHSSDLEESGSHRATDGFANFSTGSRVTVD